MWKLPVGANCSTLHWDFALSLFILSFFPIDKNLVKNWADSAKLSPFRFPSNWRRDFSFFLQLKYELSQSTLDGTHKMHLEFKLKLTCCLEVHQFPCKAKGRFLVIIIVSCSCFGCFFTTWRLRQALDWLSSLRFLFSSILLLSSFVCIVSPKLNLELIDCSCCWCFRFRFWFWFWFWYLEFAFWFWSKFSFWFWLSFENWIGRSLKSAAKCRILVLLGLNKHSSLDDCVVLVFLILIMLHLCNQLINILSERLNWTVNCLAGSRLLLLPLLLLDVDTRVKYREYEIQSASLQLKLLLPVSSLACFQSESSFHSSLSLSLYPMSSLSLSLSVSSPRVCRAKWIHFRSAHYNRSVSVTI